VDVKPPVRLKEAYSRMEDKRAQALTAPCGNFSAMYQCMCDYHAVDFMEDVAWVSFFVHFVKIFLCGLMVDKIFVYVFRSFGIYYYYYYFL